MAADIRYDDAGQAYVWNPNSKRYQPALDNPLEAFLVGAGRSLTRLGRGTQAALGFDRERLQALQQEEDQLTLPAMEQYGVASALGQAAPALATAPLGVTAAMAGRLGLGGSAALSSALGAAEGGLMLDPTGQNIDDALRGAAFGLAGDLGGRVVGRIFNMARGAGQSLARSEGGNWLSGRGLQTLPSERLNVPGQNIEPIRRLEQGAKSGVFAPAIFRETAEERQALMNQAAARAVGLDNLPGGQLDDSVLSAVDDRISQGFQDIVREAFDEGLPRTFEVGEDLAQRIMATRGQIPKLADRGRFQGLSGASPFGGRFMLQGDEIMIARRALAQDAAEAAKRGEFELADDMFADVELLDNIFADTVGEAGEELVARHARLREQYRNLQMMLKPGVRSATGDVKAPALDRALGQKVGYGTTYKLGRGAEGLQPETAELFDVSRNLARPELQPFRSSGTAENLAMRDDAAAIGAALSGDVAGGLGLAARMAAPAILARTAGSNRGANILGGMMVQAPPLASVAGRTAGLGLLEQVIGERYRARQTGQ